MDANRKKILIPGIVVVVIIAIVAFFMTRKKEDLTATTIRILQYVGDVTLSAGDKEVTMREDMQLHNGNRITTAKNGSVDLALDDSKTVGLDVASKASFHQENDALTVNLEDGSLIFYTTEKLADNESLDFNTQTMMVGIRGTSGEEFYNSKNKVSKAVATSGTLHVRAVNPKTGGIAEAEVPAGNVVQTYFYNYEEGDASIDLHIRLATPQDVSPFLMQKIMADPVIKDEVSLQNNWSLEEMQEVADSAQVVNAAVAGSDAFADNSAELRSNSLTETLITSYDSLEEAEESGDPVAQKAAQETVRRKEEASDQNEDDEDTDTPADDEDTAPVVPQTTRTPQPAAPQAENTTPTQTVAATPVVPPASAAPAPAIPAPVPAATESTPAATTSSSSSSSSGSSGSSGSSDSSGSSGDTPAPVASTATISVDTVANGTISVDKTQAAPGETVTITMTPADGYKALSPTVQPDGAIGDALAVNGSGNTYTFVMSSYNVRVSGSFGIAYAINAEASEGGTFTATPSSAAAGETISIAINPQSGYRLHLLTVSTAPTDGSAAERILTIEYLDGMYWYLDASGQPSGEANLSPLTFTMPQNNVTISGGFGQDEQPSGGTYTITKGTTYFGTITLDKETATAGDTITITTTPNERYSALPPTVMDASGNSVSVSGGNNSYSFTMPSSNVTVTGNFGLPFTITLEGDGSQLGSVSTTPSGIAISGETVSINVNPNNNSRLSFLKVFPTENPSSIILEYNYNEDGESYYDQTGTPVILPDPITFVMESSDMTISYGFISTESSTDNHTVSVDRSIEPYYTVHIGSTTGTEITSENSSTVSSGTTIYIVPKSDGTQAGIIGNVDIMSNGKSIKDRLDISENDNSASFEMPGDDVTVKYNQ